MAKASSQKFIARNRAPRVQIEYDVELYGAEKKIQLPFVMGVLADLSGKVKPDEPLPPVDDRKFLEIDVDNFDSRMKALKPRAAFQVPNTLTGEGNINVELTFESMDDFSPAAVAAKLMHPDRTVVCLAGDGSLIMNVQELATCVSSEIPVKVFLMNNGYMGMVRQWQELTYESRYSNSYSDSLPDFVKMAEAYGW